MSEIQDITNVASTKLSCTLLNHYLSQKLNPVGNCEFNHLINIVRLPHVWSQISSQQVSLTSEILNELEVICRVWFELKDRCMLCWHIQLGTNCNPGNVFHFKF